MGSLYVPEPVKVPALTVKGITVSIPTSIVKTSTMDKSLVCVLVFIVFLHSLKIFGEC